MSQKRIYQLSSVNCSHNRFKATVVPLAKKQADSEKIHSVHVICEYTQGRGSQSLDLLLFYSVYQLYRFLQY